MTPLRPVLLLVQICVFYLLISIVKFPVVPVTNIDRIIVNGSKLKCESGCELMNEQITQVSCHKETFFSKRWPRHPTFSCYWTNFLHLVFITFHICDGHLFLLLLSESSVNINASFPITHPRPG